MVDSQLLARVKRVLAGAWDIEADAIPHDAALGDYERWDSLGHITLVLALGAEFGFELTAETVQELSSIPRIVDYLGRQALTATKETTYERHCSQGV